MKLFAYLKRLWEILKFINYKTIRFNLHYFSFRDALKIPVYVSRKTYLKNLKGTINVNVKLKPGLIRLGFDDVAIFDKKRSRTIWSVHGNIIFNGIASFGHGSKINVSNGAVLSIGNSFKITAESSIVCTHKITFEENCLVSWDVLFMDSDLHKIRDKNHEVLNPSQPIYIAKNVWIGCRCLILKGASIPENTVIAAASTIAKSLNENNTVYGGNPVKPLKKEIIWTRK